MSEAVQWMEANLEDDEQKTRKYEQRALYKRAGVRWANSQPGRENRWVAGGRSSNEGYESSTEIYLPSTNEWTTGGNLRR